MNEKILITDDNESSRKIASYLVSPQRKFKVLEAVNGEGAILEILHAEPTVLVLDWKMPKLSGAQTLRVLDLMLGAVGRVGQQKIKVIVYTSTPMREFEFPKTRNFHLLGMVSKAWSLEQQKRKFKTYLRAA